MPNVRVLNQTTPEYPYQFSICTLVTNWEEYEIMKSSFEQAGFVQGCEYLVYDNSQQNVADAYEALSGFMKQAKGQYIVAVHQDVRCVDTQEVLVTCLQELTALDPTWAVCGNAGTKGYHDQVRYLENAGQVLQDTDLPKQVMSLDENLLIINRNSNITVSHDLSGYHLYGTDLCLIADLLGHTCYVIKFMVQHLSMGGSKGFRDGIESFVAGYGRKLRSRYMETTCTRFYLSNSSFKNRLMNWGPLFSLIKFYPRLSRFVNKQASR